MGTGYTRNDTPNNIADGNVINASDLDGEFDAVQAAFNGSTGHSHDGTTGEGPQIATGGLADNAVTTAKITDANVTLAKMAANSVDSDQYVDGSIDRVHLAADIVDGTKIADDSIDSEHYVDGSIDTAHIADDAVTSAKLDTNIAIAGTLGVTGVSSFANGSNSAPSLTFTSDTNTGIYRGGTDILKFVTAGTDAITIDASQDVTLAGSLTFADNEKAIFGAGSDLQIYHNGSDSYVVDAATGDLNIRSNGLKIALQTFGGTNMIEAINNGNVVLYSNGAERLRANGTGIDVTGTATMDGLTVDGDAEISSGAPIFRLKEGDNTGQNSEFKLNNGSLKLRTVDDSNVFVATRLEVDNATGDISFYEDTGTTPKLFWDASAERLGIGTVSPASLLEIKATSLNRANGIALRGSGANDVLYMYPSADNVATIEHLINGTTNTGGVLSINPQGGNVGIGTSSPDTNLDVEGAGDCTISITAGSTSHDSKIDFVHGSTIDGGITFDHNGAYASEQMVFRAGNNTPHMYLTGDGNLLVGTTDTLPSNDTSGSGIALRNDGIVGIASSNTTPLRVNRTGNDGDIIRLHKDGSEVGNIGNNTGQSYLYIANDGGCGIAFGNTNAFPANGTGALSDNTKDLGGGATRWDDVFATNGTIQTSDRNEKQDIEELSDAEQRVAVVAKGLMRKFRWIDSVAEKGDNARTHFGIIAQDLQDAFTAEGLDASKYAMFTSNTWWEKEISVDAVEADEENGIEAKDAYTYIDTKEEATEGYTERTRLGVRYNQLLAFIISAI